jgi:hypothetical protein
MPYRLGPVDFVFPELDQINKCAYWDYQRDRIYIRSNRASGESRKESTKSVAPSAGERDSDPPGPESSVIPKIRMRKAQQVAVRSAFTTGGVKRWISKYIDHYTNAELWEAVARTYMVDTASLRSATSM